MEQTDRMPRTMAQSPQSQESLTWTTCLNLNDYRPTPIKFLLTDVIRIGSVVATRYPLSPRARYSSHNGSMRPRRGRS